MSDQEIHAAAEEARHELDAMTPDECFATAKFARACKPPMPALRGREILERCALEFEASAARKLAAKT